MTTQDRILRILDYICDLDHSDVPTSVWVDAMITAGECGGGSTYANAATAFQILLADWQKKTITYLPHLTEATNTIVEEFNELLFMTIQTEDSDTFSSDCTSLRRAVRMAVIPNQTLYDFPSTFGYEWAEAAQRQWLKEKAEELRQQVVEADLDGFHKQNILTALDEVLRAIEHYEETGDSFLNNAVYRLGAMLRGIGPILAQAGICLAQAGITVFQLPEHIGNVLSLPPP